MTPADVAAARAELLGSTSAQIELQTARAWSARAVAGYELAIERRCVRWLLRASSYHHEAAEHAAGVSPECVAEVEATLAPLCNRATAAVGG